VLTRIVAAVATLCGAAGRQRSQRSMRCTAPWSDLAWTSTATRSSWSSCALSTGQYPKALRFIWFWTTTPPTSTRTSWTGWSSIPGSSCTSPQRPHPGWTWSSGGSASSPARHYAQASSTPFPTWSPLSRNTCWSTNNERQPLVWTATAESILTKVRRGRVALDQEVSQW